MALKFNKNSRADLDIIDRHIRNKFVVRGVKHLQDEDVKFCHQVLYWHKYHITRNWTLPIWAQEARFTQWLDKFATSYFFYRDIQYAMDRTEYRYS